MVDIDLDLMDAGGCLDPRPDVRIDKPS